MDVALSERIASGAPLTTYHDALDFLFARTTGGFKFGLERTAQLLAALGNPERRYPSIHVAGTNGKGSTVATMAALLAAKGMRVATYTSPHLIDFRERMTVAGTLIPASDVIAFVTRYTPLVEEIGASFFEATTAMAFDYFARAGADVALVEAGLGGRLDSTNVLQPLVAGVTSIGLDHTEYLGSTLEEIAGEKAGIFKPGAAAVIGETDPRIRDLLAERARAAGASTVRVTSREIELERVDVDDAGTTCMLRWGGRSATLRTPLAGRHQAANLAAALLMLDAAGPAYAMGLDEAGAHLERVRIPGRFQHVGPYIFDVAHNPAGIEVVAQTLASVRPPQPIAAVLCVLGDKDWRAMIAALNRVVPRFILTNAPTAPASRRWNLDDALEFARGIGADAVADADFRHALASARTGAATVLVTGSFHTVGDAMALLQVSTFSG